MSQKFDAALSLLRQSAEDEAVVVTARIDPEIRTRPMFGAELVALFINLLTNAIKAAGPNGKILVTSKTRDASVLIRLQNTGHEVTPEEGEKWFKPFASTTAKVDESLGHGMGLGLTISRRIVEEYGGQIQFAQPSSRYSTAIEVVLPA